jgi:hypothetical protein
MRRLLASLLALGALLALPAPAGALELRDFDLFFAEEDGSAALAAGDHPFELANSFEVDSVPGPEEKVFPVGAVKDLLVELPVGLIGSPTATPRCTSAEFLINKGGTATGCSDPSVVGMIETVVGQGGLLQEFISPVYNLLPAPGYVARLGFKVSEVRVVVDLGLSEAHPHRVFASVRNISQALEFFSSDLRVAGAPAGPSGTAFLVNPRACAGPLTTTWRTSTWGDPGAPPAEGFARTRDELGAERGFFGCAGLPFAPKLGVQPTNDSAQSPTGLQVDVEVPHNEGLTDPEGRAASDIRAVKLTLPRGMTVNPSQAEGLGTCDEEDLDEESADSEPGEGCPQESKIGTVEVKTPLLPEESFSGELFVATPYENPFDSLIALYMTVKNRERGVGITLAGRVEPDPETGRLITTFGDPSSSDPAYRALPQLPFSSFRVRLREGGRSPLVTPPGCGSFAAQAEFTAWSGASQTETSTFEIDAGPGGGECPRGAPFAPGFGAGTLNNAAGAFSPFVMRITRQDGHQDLSRFSATLPPGVAGSLAGIPWCPEAGIARARSRDGERGGVAELRDPSCPAASLVGRTLAGAGVGGQLTYVPGSLYLAGPFGGAPLSVVSVTPAVAGPFDAGTVVVRVALRVDPKSGRVEVDGAASDPIPHILQGIPLNVRDLRVFADRPAFTFNATSCEPSASFATLWGAGTALRPLPEAPVGLAAPYQAASCAALGFKPKLAIKLRGGARRGAHPALRAVVTPRPGDANFSRAVVTLPRSAFLEQAHIRTVCTRVQFAAPPGHGAHCPQGSIYGRARAWSPILDAPAEGPVFLRSSENQLPDLVVALTGPPQAAAQVELSARIDSIRGGIRSTFTGIPDLPVSRFILDMQGGKKGLIVNSRHLCRKPNRNRARSSLVGQNGRVSKSKPRVIAVKCQKRRKAGRAKAKRSAARVARASAMG